MLKILQVVSFSILLLIPNFLLSQKLEGYVTSTNGDSLISASVLFMEAHSIVEFSVSNNKGYFALNTNCDKDSILIKCNYLGYKPYQKLIDCKQPFLDIVLESLDVELNEVTIKEYKVGIRTKGDTLIYDPEVFTDGSESNLKEVLEKLPGVSVEDNGQLMIQGKEVERVMLNGDDFMNKNRSTLLQNLDSEDVISLEYLDHFDKSEQRYLTKLNINTKKTPYHVDLALGYGINNTNRFFVNAYSIRDSFKCFVDLKKENTGNHLFSDFDLMSFQQNSLFNDGSKNNRRLLVNKKGKQNSEYSGSANLSWTTRKNKIKLNVLGGKKKNLVDKRQNIFLTNNEAFSSTRKNKAIDLLFGGINFEYSNHNSSKFSYKLASQVILNENTSTEEEANFFAIDSIFLKNETESKNYMGNITASSIYHLNKKHRIHADIGAKFDARKLYSEWQSSQEIALPQGEKLFAFDYQIPLTSFSVASQIRHQWNFQNFTLNNSFEYYATRDFFKDYRFANISLSNHTNAYEEHVFKTSFNKEIGLFELLGTVGVQQNNLVNDFNQFNLFTNWTGKFFIQKNQNIQLLYELGYNPSYLETPLNQYFKYESTIFYRELEQLNKLSKSQKFQVHYSLVNPFKNLFLFSLVQHSIIDNAPAQHTSIFENYTEIQNELLELSKRTLFLLSIDKKWSEKKIGLKTQFSYLKNKQPILLNDFISTTSREIQSAKFHIYSIRSNVNFGLKSTLNRINIENIKQYVFDGSAYLKVRTKDNKFEYLINNRYNFFSNEHIKYYQLDTNFSYNFKMNNYQMSVGIEGSDLLNLNHRIIQRLRLQNSLITENTERIQSGYLLGLIKINF